MISWIKKKLGYHVCEEFTQWQTMRGTYEREPDITSPGDFQAMVENRKIIFTKRWQERQCTICGKIEQRSLEHN